MRKSQKLRIHNIGLLVNIETAPLLRRSGGSMNRVGILPHATLLIEEGKIVSFGPEHAEKIEDSDSVLRVDAKEGAVFPSFCDSHTHILFPASRETEMFDRLRGLSYGEIAKRGGGILNTSRRLREISDEELLLATLNRLNQVMSTGTGSIEIKSGYGLNTKQELRMLRLIRQLKKLSPLTIQPTFLGAHAFPENLRQDPERYMRELIDDMIPQVAQEQLADYVDVFCEEGFFSLEQTERIIEAAVHAGLKARLHTNQFTHSGAIHYGTRKNIVSVDHLETLNKQEIEALGKSETIATLLPGCSFFMNAPYAPGRELLDADCCVALASDYNPGTNPSGDMKFILSLAALKLKFSFAEALQGCTLNGAAAMGLSETRGSIAVGKRADLFITTPLPSAEYLAYAYTTPLMENVILDGVIYPLKKSYPDIREFANNPEG